MAVLPHDASAAAGLMVPSDRRVWHPDALLYCLWGLFCTLMIGVALHDAPRSGGHPWWQSVLWEGIALAYGTGLLLLQRTLGRRYLSLLGNPLRWFGKYLQWLPLVALGFTPVVYGVRYAVFALIGLPYFHESWAVIVPYEAVKLSLFIGLWLGVIFSFDSLSRWQGQQRHLLELQRDLSEARLAQLSAQLRPHFLFNALNTISALMHLDVARADRLLSQLADLLRANLEMNGQESLPLREELRLLELYAQIMLERFADRVAVAWHVDETTLNAGVPAMLLQPLLENAFKHAVERGRSKVSIEITASPRILTPDARGTAEALVVSIRNTGSQLAPNFREGVGLRNCRERLRVMYGDAASLQLTASGDAVEAMVTLPWQDLP